MVPLRSVCLCCSTGAQVDPLYGVCTVCATLWKCQRCVLCERRWHDPQPGDVRRLEEAGGYMCASECFLEPTETMRAWESELPPGQ